MTSKIQCKRSRTPTTFNYDVYINGELRFHLCPMWSATSDRLNGEWIVFDKGGRDIDVFSSKRDALAIIEGWTA